MNIFSIIGPLSEYLLISGLDLLKCVQMVKISLDELKKIKRKVKNRKAMRNDYSDSI